MKELLQCFHPPMFTHLMDLDIGEEESAESGVDIVSKDSIAFVEPDSGDFWEPPVINQNDVSPETDLPRLFKRLSAGKARNLVPPDMNLMLLGMITSANMSSRQTKSCMDVIQNTAHLWPTDVYEKYCPKPRYIRSLTWSLKELQQRQIQVKIVKYGFFLTVNLGFC